MRCDVSTAATGCGAVDQVHSHCAGALIRRASAEARAIAARGGEDSNLIISHGRRTEELSWANCKRAIAGKCELVTITYKRGTGGEEQKK